MSDQYPVTVAVRRPDGSVEQVRVGTAVRTADGFSLKLGELTIGAAPEAARRAPAPQPAAYGGGQQAYGGSAGGGYQARPPAGGAPTNFPNYGRSKGAPIAGATMQDLEYYANGARRSLADQSKARWHDKERELLAAIEAELARQGHGGGGGGGMAMPSDGGPRWNAPPDPEPPPHSDDDIPF